MNLVFLQRLDQAGGGSRASLCETLQALRKERPDWRLTLVSQESGPVARKVLEWGIGHRLAAMPRFRKPFERLAFWRECRRTADALAEDAPDGILSNEWVTAPHALRMARRLKIPALSYVRDFAAIERGRKYQLHRMDRLLCVCESMRGGLIAAGYDADRVRTVYNPVLQPAIEDPEPAAQGRILSMSHVDRWLLYLGRISSRKNQLAAVETLKLLREKSGQRWGMILAGDEDAEYASAVDQAAHAAGLSEAVVRVGLVARPGWLFQLAEASVLTSRSEGLARVLIESFLCGTPAFSYPLDGLEDIYGGSMKNFVADRREPAALAARILETLADKGAWMDQTESLRRMLEARHSVESHVRAFEQAVSTG